LTVSNKDMEFSDWQLLLLSRIMAVYGMQPMVLGILTDTTGKLNSEVQSEQYKKNTIIPLVKLFCNMMNSVLVWGDANLNFDNIYLTSSNLDIDDEDKQAKIWEIFLRSGVITINQVRDKLQMPPVDWGNEPFVPLNFSPLSILREYQMSRIEANRKNAMNDGIDNNVDGVDDKKKKVKKKDSTNVMVENYEVPTGLEKVDPTIVKDVVAKLIKEREKKTTFVDFSGYSIDSLMGSIQGQGLSWSNVLKSR